LSDDFDWNPLGEAWWRDTARQLGASDKQTKFAAAKHRGCSNTEAARQAGYEASTESGLRTTGYRLARANIIEKLLAFAAGEGVGSEGNVDRQEARRILSSLARGSDPSVRIRAVEQLARFDEADRQQRLAQQEPEPKEVAANILRACPYMGPGIIADCYLAEAGTPWGIPYLKELAPFSPATSQNCGCTSENASRSQRTSRTSMHLRAHRCSRSTRSSAPISRSRRKRMLPNEVHLAVPIWGTRLSRRKGRPAVRTLKI
jgi:hypothetical protein